MKAILELTPAAAKRSVCALLAVLTATLAAGCSWVGLVSPNASGDVATVLSAFPGLGIEAASGTYSASADARYVAFASTDDDVVPGHSNSNSDVYLRDTLTGNTVLASPAPFAGIANGASSSPSVSADGRYVAFESLADNLVTNDVNGASDIFVFDRITGTVDRVSFSSAGAEANAASIHASISGDGRFVAFSSAATNLVPSDTNGFNDIFVRDTVLQITELVSNRGAIEANERSLRPDISGDGNHVAFVSRATNLVFGGSGPSLNHIFKADRLLDSVALMSMQGNHTPGNAGSHSSGLTLIGFLGSAPSISDDGRYVAFYSQATNLIAGGNPRSQIFVRDTQSEVTEQASVSNTGGPAFATSSASISGDGRYVAFWSFGDSLVSGDTNGKGDFFLRDRTDSHTTRISYDFAQNQIADPRLNGPVLSSDGRYIVFKSVGTGLLETDKPDGGGLYIRAIPSPTITSITPSNLEIGETTSVVITGRYFFPNPTLSSTATATNVVYIDEKTITADLFVPANSDPGFQFMTIKIPGTGPGLDRGPEGSCAGCFSYFEPN